MDNSGSSASTTIVLIAQSIFTISTGETMGIFSWVGWDMATLVVSPSAVPEWKAAPSESPGFKHC